MIKKRNIALQVKRIAILGSVMTLGVTLLSGTASAVEAPLTLGTASTYGVLASSAITSTVSTSSVTGTAGTQLGVGGGTAPTGVISPAGTVILGGAAITALSSASAALAESRGGTSTGVELGGVTLTAGAYTGGSFGITGTLTLNGQNNADAIFIIRAASTLITDAASTVVLTNGAQACNVFWQVGSSATLGASSTMVGHVIAGISISTGASTTVNGQLIATTGAVTLGGTTIVNNSCAVVTPPVVTPPVVTPPVEVTPVIVAVPVVAPVVIPPATLRVVKKVINSFGGTATDTAFVIHVIQNGKEVAGSPVTTLGGTGRSFSLAPGNYIIYEDRVAGYRGVWAGTISTGGSVSLVSGQDLTVTRTNFDMNPPADATDTPVVPAPAPEPTEDGGVLPNTSTPWWNLLLLGGGLTALGSIGMKSRKSSIK
jgi:hypothetical protein